MIPPAPPFTVTMVASSLKVKVSLLVPPIKFSMLVKVVPNLGVKVPAFAPVIVQALATLAPVKVSEPLPPLMDPSNEPVVKMKLSVKLPPMRLSKLVKFKVMLPLYNEPLLVPVIVQTLSVFSPCKVLLPVPTVISVMLEKVLPNGSVGVPSRLPLKP